MIRRIISKFFAQKKKETKPRDFEWEKFQQVAREQFLRLREKGISIPVVTL